MFSFELFPPIEPYVQGRLQVDDVHNLYWEECGNPNGVPIVFLHGGPGSGTYPEQRRLFDPEYWRIILFDQRGAGKSTPLGEIRNNTTDHLISDMEKLREARGIDKWHAFGGSWGSTLALAYAQTHPTRCLGLILRGVFLMRQSEIDWFLFGIKNFFPESWEKFTGFLPPEKRATPLESYAEIVFGKDKELKKKALQTFVRHEKSCARLLPPPTSNIGELGVSIMPLIEAHYFLRNKFTPEDKLLKNIDRIRHIPTIIVQGRYDMICPIVTAHELHCAWPEADYRIVPYAGHSMFDHDMCSALIDATEDFKNVR